MPSAAARSLFLCIRLVGGTVAEVDRSAVDRSRRIDTRSALASLPGWKRWCFSPFFFFFRERATYEEIGSVGSFFSSPSRLFFLETGCSVGFSREMESGFSSQGLLLL